MSRTGASLILILILTGAGVLLPLESGRAQSVPAAPASPFPPRTTLPVPVFPSPARTTAAPAPAPAPAPPLAFSLDVVEQGTDNAYSTATARRSDLVSTIDPTVTLAHDSDRFQANATYNLSYDRYALNGSLDGLRSEGLGLADATVIEQHLFLDSRFGITERDTSSAGPGTAGPRTAARNRTQVTTVSATPRAEQHLGRWAVAEALFSHDESFTDTPASTAAPAVQALQATPAGRTGGPTASRGDDGKVVMRSGEDFSRLQWSITGDLSRRSQGTGAPAANILDQTTATFDAEYKLDGSTALLAQTGRDDFRGTSVNPSINGLFYTIGIHWTPSTRTDIRAGYGWRYGAHDLFLLGEHWLGPRTLVRISRSTGVFTDSLAFADALNAVRRDPSGAFIDPFSGAAADLAGSTPSISSATYRQNTTLAMLSRKSGRETVSISGQLTDQQVVGGVAPGQSVIPGTTLGTSSATLALSLEWAHQIDPHTILTVTLARNEVVQSSSAAGRIRRNEAHVVVNRQLAANLTGFLNYGYVAADQPAGQGVAATGTIAENSLILGLTRHF